MIHKPYVGTGHKRLYGLLPVLFLLLTLSSCGAKLDHAYDINTALLRMNSVSASQTSTSQAHGFADGLAIPGETDFNKDNVTSPAFLLVPLGSDSDHPEALSYSNPYVKTYPASITKVMTALVCLENTDDLQREFTVTKNSVIKVSGSSTAFLHEGETLSIENLLYGMLLPSGNDAAVAVAEATAGSVDAFVRMMNEEALKLGCTGTHFANPNGLPDENHYTTPYDIYLILHKALQYDEFRKIVGTTDYKVQYKDKNGMPKTQEWKGSNQFMLGEVPTPDGYKVLGGKTGTTNAAGYCLAMDVQKTASGEEYIAVSMKNESKADLYTNMTNLILKIH